VSPEKRLFTVYGHNALHIMSASGQTLRLWARHIVKWRRQRRTVFVYFDNDQKSAAPSDARRLLEMLRPGRPG
jgi:uncharacterized protein YecE (DUF72 family)